jgi:DNA-binding NtrC family response regulator
MAKGIKKILIVEDDLSLRPLWEVFLSRRFENISIDWVVSCEEALKIVDSANKESKPFFLIITDIFLAGSGTGMELLASDAVAQSGAKTILVSAVDRDEIIEKFGHLLPHTEVMTKPIDFRKYERVIGNILNSTHLKSVAQGGI